MAEFHVKDGALPPVKDPHTWKDLTVMLVAGLKLKDNV